MRTLRMIILATAALLFSAQTSCGLQLRNSRDLKDLYWNFVNSRTLILPGEFETTDRFTVTLFDGARRMNVSNKIVGVTPTNATIRIYPPWRAAEATNRVYVLNARQRGRLSALAEYRVNRDTEPPSIGFVETSPSIQRGGSALVIFGVNDTSMGTAWVVDNRGQRFMAQPFIRRGFYATLIGWYVKEETYKAWIVAKDEAGNTVSNALQIKTLPYTIQTVNLRFQPSYVTEKTEELGITNDLSGMSTSNQIAAVNQAMRATVEVSVWDITSQAPAGLLTNINFRNFNPAPNAYRTSSFALLRRYLFDGQVMRQSYHMGLDLAKTPVSNFNIFASNPARIAFAGYHGGYGNLLILNHGMGLYSEYGHCSRLLFQTGATVSGTNVVAISGKTGVATGDHLHFGMLVQGLYVNPTQWMSLAWVKENINNVAERARVYILLLPDETKETNDEMLAHQ